MADNADGDSGNGGAVSASTDAPKCSFPGCDNAALPGQSQCGLEVHSVQTGVLGHDPGDGPGNSGPDGSFSDGTWSPSDPNATGWSDGTGRSQRKARHRHRDILHYLEETVVTARELRSEQFADDCYLISGTAIVYDTRTLITDRYGKFGERIQRGAAAHLVNSDVRLLANHDGLPLARTAAGTLVLRDTPKGVTFAAWLDSTSPMAMNVLAGVRRGDLSGCSFAFTVDEAHDHWNPQMTERTIKRLSTLPEVSVVTFPAYPTTTVAARSKALIEHQRRLRLRGERLHRLLRSIELHERYGVPMSEPKQTTTKRDDLKAKERTLQQAGQARRAAMKARDAKTYRSLRVQINNGRDLEEIRDAR